MKNSSTYLFFGLGAAALVLYASNKKSPQTSVGTNKKIPDDQVKPTESHTGYKFVDNCQSVTEEDLLKTINYAKAVGQKYDPSEWNQYLFKDCLSGDKFFSNVAVARYSFDLYKYAATGAVSAGKMSKEDAKHLLLNFKQMAYEAGIHESETWYVELMA